MDCGSWAAARAPGRLRGPFFAVVFSAMVLLLVVVQDSSSEEDIEVKLPKQKNKVSEGAEDQELYRRAYQRMFELH